MQKHTNYKPLPVLYWSFAEAPIYVATHILRVCYSVDMGITTTTPPTFGHSCFVLKIAGWPASNLLFSSNFNQSAYAT